jgi:starch synthase (maltosyl-transferring)
MSPTSRKSTARIPDELYNRVWIENLCPRVDGGRFPVKRTVGEQVIVTADIFADGHDAICAALLYRRHSEETWRETPMVFRGNDVWTAEFIIETLELYTYTVEAWLDPFATWRDGLMKKFQADQDVESDLLEGAELLAGAAARAVEPERGWLMQIAELLREDAPQGERVARVLGDEVAALVSRFPDRTRATRYAPALEVMVERKLARCGAWYEMFPRSCGSDPFRSATFGEAEKRLADIARMGFDVLYLPPIHPIGTTNRKGREGSLHAAPGDPGSPWAIGSEEGGHTAVHPDLGTLKDFERFVEAARVQGLEVALDIAFQCSPDHPYVREHPEWFRHRPDGSIKYAENPPKRYEDIYPLNFESPAWADLWIELKGVVRFWVERGIRIFRVDNPHTKPIRFWEWLISEIKRDHPEVIFLSEAFTRPKMMYALAKVGFSQSYTYFTWRNTKRELIEYLDALITTEVREFFRPNFFTNTPDILPEFLQFGGRAAFQTRLVLAATMAANYGIYSGFELCETEAVSATEEYRNSEKYEIRHRDWKKPDSITDYIAKVNAIRRKNPALWHTNNLCFYPVDNEHLIFYGKATEDLSSIILVVVNLDPYHVQEGWVEVPLEEYGLTREDVYQVHDLLGEGRFLWQERKNYVRLDPSSSPAQIFRLRRRVRTERDFDYFL